MFAQRDHGNREVRANARLKYLVHTLGVDNFRKLVEMYYGKKIDTFVKLPPWRMVDWMGWHEQGDGKWFRGIIVEQGRIKNEGKFQLKKALRTIVDKYNLDTRLTADQNIVLGGIDPKDKADIDAILSVSSLPLSCIHEHKRACLCMPKYRSSADAISFGHFTAFTLVCMVVIAFECFLNSSCSIFGC